MDKSKKSYKFVTLSAIIFIFAFLANAYAEQLSVTLKAGDYEIVDLDDGYQQIKMEGFGYAGEVSGTPRLPARIFQIALPPGAKVTSVDVEGLREAIQGQYKIEPAPPIRTFSLDEDIVKESKRLWQENYDRVYSSDSPYPERIAWQINYGSLRNIPYVDVIFLPFAFQPHSGRLSICNTLNVVVHYSVEKSSNMYDPIPEIFIIEAERLFVNFYDVRDNYSVLEKGRGTADYLIILYDSTSTTVDAIQPLINWKKSRGYTVKVVDCGNTGYGAINIRNYLRSNYSGWGTMYVLLVAPAVGKLDIPMRRCYTINHDTDLLTDYYFAELSLADNLSWDSDEDGWYGEYPDDNVTFVPEVYVGRIPFNANTQHDIVRSICERAVDFDGDMGTWKGNAMLLGAIAYFDTLGSYWDCSAQMEHIRTNVAGLTYNTMYEKDDWIHATPACTWPLTEANLVARWGTGNYAVVEWASHGGVHDGWRSYSHTGPPQVLWDEFIRGGNGPVLSGSAPIAFSSCCLTGNVESDDGCLATELMENDAAAAFMGATRVSYNNQPWLTYYFIDHLMGTTDAGQVGRAFYNGKVDYWNNYGGNGREQANMLMFNLYGEPNMLRAGTNALPNITYTTPSGWSYSIVPRGNSSATWTNCYIPSTLPGNSNSTYLNWAMRNSGSVIARDVNSRIYLDDVALYNGWIEWINAGSSDGHQNVGPITVRGGRHTLMDSLDWTHTIYETNEYDNRYRRQFIWSPYQLANQTPVSRSAPPLKGSMTYPNCDGFSFPDGTFTRWRGVGILPTASGNDYDLRLHNDYTGSTQGFGTYLESSGSWGTQSDFVLVNERSTASSGTYYAGVNRYSGGTSNFRIQRADDGTTIYAPDTTGTFTIHSYDIIDVHEIYIGQTGLYRFTLDNISGTADLGISLYDAHQPYFGKWDYMTGAYSNSNTGGQDESFMIEITTTGYYGFVVWKSDHTDLGKSNTYKIMIETKEEGAWEGDVSFNWHTAGNWFGGSVPNSSMDVFIPSGTPYSPVIYTNHANCLDLTVDAGATLTLINKTLYAEGDVQFSGTINTTGTGYYIRCRGNWLDYGNFNPGTGYYVIIDGSVIQYIVNGDFYNLTISNGAHARILWSDLQADANILIHGTLDSYSSGYSVSANYISVYSTGTFDARGLDVSTNGNFQVKSGGTVNLDDDDASISSGLDIIINGTFDCGTSSPNIYCNDDWIDTSGTFIEGYSTVYFNGTGTQDIRGGETFWNVVVNKSAGEVQPYDANVSMYSLDIASGTFDLNTRDANITSDAIIRGHLEMDHANDDFNVGDDLIWDATATATVTSGEIRCGDDWDVNEGCDVQLTGGTVIFNGSYNGYIHMYDSSFTFNNILVDKDSSHWIKISSYSTYPVDVNGFFTIYPFATFDTKYKTIEVAGNWLNNGIFTPTGGKVIFDGTTQSINNGSGNFWDLDINVSGTATTSTDLDINDDFTIVNGTYNPSSHKTYVGGDWNDTLGTFHPANTGNWVIFDGNGQQLIYQKGSNYFQGVEIWNTGSSPAQVRAETDLTFLYYFNITSGDFNVNGHDLFITRALQLGYMPSHSGNLTQYSGTIWCEGTNWYAGTVDLRGGIICSSFDNTYYPNWNDTLITFQASGDHTVEMVGSSDITITQGLGNHFKNLTINKSTKRNKSNNPDSESAPITYTGLLPTSTPAKDKTNTATANSDLNINGNLYISNGVLESGNNTLTVAGDWTNDIGDAGFIEGTGTVIFDGSQSACILNDETFYNLSINKSYTSYNGLEFGTQGAGKNINVLNNMDIIDGTVEINIPCTLDVNGDIQIALNAGLNANDGINIYIDIGDDWTDYNPVFSATKGFNYGYSTVIFDGNGFQDISGDSVNFYNLRLASTNPTPYFQDLELFGSNKLLRIHNDLHLERGGMEINANSILDIDGDVLIDSAAGLDADDGGIKIYVGENWTNAGNIAIDGGGPSDGFDELNSSVVFNCTGDSHIGDDTFDTLRIDKGGSKELGTLTYGGISDAWFEDIGNGRYRTESFENKRGNTVYADSTIIATNIWVDNGTFETADHTISVTHNLNINDTLKMDSNAFLQIGDTLNVNNGGVLECSGVDTSSMATVTRTGTGYFAFNINSGGTISPIYTVFEFVDLTGINIKNGAVINTATRFDGCTFRNGEAGGTLLRIENTQVISIQDAVFPENTWAGLHNVTKLLNQGIVEFVYPYGDFAGDDYDNDPYDRIYWVIDTTSPLISKVYPPQDTVICDSLPTISASFYDTETGIDTLSIILVLNNDTVDALITDSTVSYTPDTALSDTVHEVILYISDNRKNETIHPWEFEVDVHAPASPGLISPSDSSWLNDTLICFEWSEVLKGIVGSNKERVLSLSSEEKHNALEKDFIIASDEKHSTIQPEEYTLKGKHTSCKRHHEILKASEVSYIIQVDTTDSFNNPVAIDTIGVAVDTINLGEDTYFWHIKAFDLAGNESSFSEIWSFSVDTTIPYITSVFPPVDTLITDNLPTIEVKYGDVPSGVDTGQVVLIVDGDIVTAIVTDSMVSYTPSIAFADTFHSITAYIYDVASNSTSTSWSFEVDATAPEKPTLINPEDSLIISNNTPTFVWSKETKKSCVGFRSSDISNLELSTKNTKLKSTSVTYTLQCATDGGFTDLVIDTTCLTDTIFTSGTLPDTNYYWSVEAVDSADNHSGYSNPYTFYVDTKPPEIESTTVWRDTTYTGPFPVYSTVGDENGISSVELWYSTSINPTWLNIAMDTAKGVDQYTGEIPQQPENTEVYYYIDAQDNATPPNESKDPWNAPDSSHSFIVLSSTGITEEKPVPQVYFLSQNYPNPFVHSTSIKFGLPIDSRVNLSLYNLSGQRIITLINHKKKAGYYLTTWFGLNNRGRRVSPGIYFYRLETDNYVCTKKLLLLR